MRVLSMLEFNDPAHHLNVQAQVWQDALSKALPDPIVGIRHGAIAGNADYRIHVAAIPRQVGCHFHAQGSEVYEVVEGTGRLHFGRVVNVGEAFEVNWETPVDVATGDRFVIPEGYAHQLRKQGKCDLTILFACPDSHLNDAVDRTILPDAPR